MLQKFAFQTIPPPKKRLKILSYRPYGENGKKKEKRNKKKKKKFGSFI